MSESELKSIGPLLSILRKSKSPARLEPVLAEHSSNRPSCVLNIKQPLPACSQRERGKKKEESERKVDKRTPRLSLYCVSACP